MKIMFQKIKYFLLILVAGGLFILFSPTVTHAATTFSDIDGHPYQESIRYLLDHGIVQGYPNGTFGPDLAINRGELLKIILEASLPTGQAGVGADIGSGKDCFPDVHDEWFAKYVCYAKDHNMIKGYDDGTFKPMQPVIVAEALKMGLQGFNMNVSEAGGDKRYQPYIDFVHNNTIFSKYSLLPLRNMTRGQMAYLVYKLLLEKNGTIQFDGIRDVKSAGCGKLQPDITPTSSVVNGITRNYITVIGNNYNPNTPMKIIFAFHGRTNPNTMVRTYYGIEQASRGDAIIIYPAGLPEEGPSRSRSSPGDKPSQLRDFALFDQLLAEFENNYCIDKDQVYVVGHSLGAWFTNSLSCARGDVIRGIGSVGGGTTINDCNGPVAAMIMQNPADNLSSPAAGITARDQMLRQNSCGPETEPYGDVGNCVEYTNCQEGAPVVWCPYTDSMNEQGQYYPHVWPRYAGATIWDFFLSLN